MRKGLLASAATVLLACAPLAARAQVPTVDFPQIMQEAKTVMNTAQQVNQLVQMGQQVFGMARSIGTAGPMGMMSYGMNSISSLSSIAPNFDLNRMVPSGTNIGRLGLSAPSSSTFQRPDTSSAWVQQTAYAPEGRELSAEDVSAYRSLRMGMQRQAAVNAYGLAAHSREMAARSPEIQQTVTTEAQGATDLRTDIAANTGALLQIHQRLVQIQALLAAQVELDAAHMIAADEVITRRN